MGRKLTIVVACTDRKSAVPHPSLLVRNLPGHTYSERSDAWLERLDTAVDRVPLRRLYQGETWTQVLQLERAAKAVGFDTTLVVASAGLGLTLASDSAPAYGATFSARHADSVASNPQGVQAWWNSLKTRTGTVPVDDLQDGALLMVLSESYASAMAHDLAGLGGRSDVIVFGGSREVPADVRIPADRQLRGALGGTTTSLNVRSAIRWLQLLPEARINPVLDRSAWDRWANSSRRPDVYDRAVVTDAQVREFVSQLRAAEPTVTATRALRQLRDAGKACEQKRFARLFKERVIPS